MMHTTAYDTGTAFLFRVNLDTTRTIPDPTLPAPADGDEDTRPLVPDPDWIVEFTWGKEPPEGRALVDYLADCKVEAERLAALDPRLQPAPTEIELS